MQEQYLEEFINLCDTIEEKIALQHELTKTAKDRFGEALIDIEREGKKIQVKQKILWEEIWQLGQNSDAGKVLKEKYPDIFAIEDELVKLKMDRTKLSMEHFGFLLDEQMSPASLVKLIRGIVKLELKK